ncbi:MAG: alanine--tRNA ligase, partial [Chloroflexota bacterium]|nr:alanine--tRNA ligase [Chloroflexota bacterium]
MNSDDIRREFVRYFEEQGHLHLPSASLVVHDDPSVLLTSAGMQPFKPSYLDPSRAPARRVVTVQRCMRARGLDTDDTGNVGDDTHHTFFEMLGNFAFGSSDGGGYFKKEAIAFGYEFVTQRLGLAPERIWATTWAGEPGIPADDEAVALWREVGLPHERIRPLNQKPEGGRENFWGPTGDSGPCGPCSEIHFDLIGRCPWGASDTECGPDHGCGRIVELWNLVFNQYYQEPDKTLRPLEHTGVDTGAGFERIVAVLQGVPSAYESDLLRPIVREAEALLDAPYGEDPTITRSLRIVVDHARAVTFMIGDGVFPSNAERGYVARRLLRRAVRYGRLLGREGPFMGRLATATIERFGAHYPYLRDRQALIERVIAEEEARFSETLTAGLQLLNNELDRLERNGETTLSGDAAFRLYGTYGFPVELTQEVAEGRGFRVDTEGVAAELRAARQRSQGGSRFAKLEEVDLPAVTVRFEGYSRLSIHDSRILYLSQGGERVTTAAASAESSAAANAEANRSDSAPGDPGLQESSALQQTGSTDGPGSGPVSGAAGTPAGSPAPENEVWVVLDRTPFYAERGGQVGDQGWIIGPHGRLRVRTTQVPVGEVVVHIGEVVDGAVAEGETVQAEVDATTRSATMRHHTATHLLHAALRAELGAHVHQTGSLVAPDRLRFDFSHGEALSAAQRQGIQSRVNEAIRRNLEVRTDVLPVEEAMRSGALALFDEKYGDAVRVLTIGDVSKELCGGTHVGRSGDLGFFVVAAEGSVGSGTRRIEALAGATAEAYLSRQLETLEAVGRTLDVPPEQVPARVAGLVGELAQTRRRLEAAERWVAQVALQDVLGRAQEVAGPGGWFKLLAVELDATSAPTPERLREVADWLRDKVGGPSVLL